MGFITIPFNQVKTLTPPSEITCGGFAIGIALDESSEEEDFLKFSSADAFEAGLIVSLPAALLNKCNHIASKGIKGTKLTKKRLGVMADQE